jgi:putative PIN family toxin of toxin-antitoxin system
MRAVVDTNILVRAIIKPDGTVGPVLHQLRLGRYTILYARVLLAELVDVLNRPRIRHKYHLSDDDIKTVLGLVLLRGEPVTPQRTIAVCRDPKDDKFLEVAIAGKADAIVSGDDDLLALNPFEGIPIITPRAFLRLLATEDDE